MNNTAQHENQSVEQTMNELRTLWHPLFHQLLDKLLAPIDIRVKAEAPAAEQPPKIDLILQHDRKIWTAEQRAVLPDGIRERPLQHHQIELKVTESLTNRSFKQVFMYDFLYPQTAKIKEEAFQTYLVSAKTPHKKNLTRWGYQQAEHPGVYVSTLPVFEDVILILLNQLRDVPHNNYFRLFASRRKVREAAFEYVLQTHAPHIHNDEIVKEILDVLFALAKAYDMEVEGVKMEQSMTVERLLEMGDGLRKKVLATASTEERLMGLKPEERIMGLKPEAIFNMFPPEMRFIGLKPEERVIGLKPEERFIGLKPEERLAGLSPVEKRLLLAKLQDSLEAEERVDSLSAVQENIESDSGVIDSLDPYSDDSTLEEKVSDGGKAKTTDNEHGFLLEE